MASSTKENIINQSIKLYNEFGIKNVRLQHIADACSISTGNLAYHFPEHHGLVAAVIKYSIRDVKADKKQWEACAQLIDFDNLLIRLHSSIQKHSYLFVDLLEIRRSYPSAHQPIGKYFAELHSNIKKGLSEYIESDSNPTDEDRLEKKLVNYIKVYAHTTSVLDEKMDENQFRYAIWKMVKPYLIQQGLDEFEILIQPKFF